MRDELAVGRERAIRDRLRVRLVGALDEGPGGILAAAAGVGAAVSAFALLLGYRGIVDGNRFRAEVALVVAGAAGVFAGSVVAAWALRRRSAIDRDLRHGHAASASTAFLVALTLWMPFLMVPIYFRAEASKPPTEQWLAYGFLDKRWMTSLYLLGTLGLMLALVTGRWVTHSAAARPSSWRKWIGDLGRGHPSSPPAAEAVRDATARFAVKALVGAALAAYFFAPPWHNGNSVGSIDGHMDSHLGPIQAVAHGAVPYIGAAASQYGPGSQLIEILYVHHLHPSIVGLREAFALFHWIGATIFVVALCLRFPLRIALPASLVAILMFPTLQLFGFVRDVGYLGFWGWANVLRYAGAFAVALFLSSVLARATRRRRVAAGAVLGICWGTLSYVAQENLLAGVIIGGVLTGLFLLTRTYSPRAAGEGIAAIAAGFVVSWVPVIAYYASVGSLGRFLELYAFMPAAVASGYSNTPYLNAGSDPWAKTYFALPVVLLVLGIISMLEFRPVRLAQHWSRERVALVSTVVAAIAFHNGALLRADSWHLINTMLALPVAIVVLIAYGPRIFGIGGRAAKLAFVAAIGALTLALLPSYLYRPQPLLDRLVAPAETRFDANLTDPPPEVPQTSIAARRVGASLVASPSVRPPSMREFVSFMDTLHRLIGTRATYVAAFPDVSAGVVSYAADLRPVPLLLEPSTMIINVRVYEEFLAHFRAHIEGVEAVVTPGLMNPETVMFERAFPQHRTVTLTYRGTPVYVLLR